MTPSSSGSRLTFKTKRPLFNRARKRLIRVFLMQIFTHIHIYADINDLCRTYGPGRQCDGDSTVAAGDQNGIENLLFVAEIKMKHKGFYSCCLPVTMETPSLHLLLLRARSQRHHFWVRGGVCELFQSEVKPPFHKCPSCVFASSVRKEQRAGERSVKSDRSPAAAQI